MSMFAAGEVAIYWEPLASGHGDEVVITSGLHYEWINGPPDWKETRVLVYDIDVPNPMPGYEYVATPEQLRKKRPPQDWHTLCKLDVAPNVEEETA